MCSNKLGGDQLRWQQICQRSAVRDTLNQFREPWVLFQTHSPVQFHITKDAHACNQLRALFTRKCRTHLCQKPCMSLQNSRCSLKWWQLADWLTQITSKLGLIKIRSRPSLISLGRRSGTSRLHFQQTVKTTPLSKDHALLGSPALQSKLYFS